MDLSTLFLQHLYFDSLGGACPLRWGTKQWSLEKYTSSQSGELFHISQKCPCVWTTVHKGSVNSGGYEIILHMESRLDTIKVPGCVNCGRACPATTQIKGWKGQNVGCTNLWHHGLVSMFWSLSSVSGHDILATQSLYRGGWWACREVVGPAPYWFAVRNRWFIAAL